MSDEIAGLERRVDKLEDTIVEHEKADLVVHSALKELGIDKLQKMERDFLTRLVKLDTQMDHLIETLKTFVNHSQFEPVRLIAYGLAAGVLTTVLGAVMMKLGGFIK